MDASPQNRRTIQAYSQLSVADFEALGPEGDLGRRALLNPAIFELIGEPSGQYILDAGCGHGYLARLLAGRGARVVGLEPAEVPLRYATDEERRRHDGITYLQRDLSRPGDLGGPFDIVIANMVFANIPDWQPALGACVGALRPGGQLVFSLHHPLWDPEQSERATSTNTVEVRDYFTEREIGVGHAPNFHRPLGAYMNETIRLGCVITGVMEPRLLPEQVEQPAQEIFTRTPNFIVISARRT